MDRNLDVESAEALELVKTLSESALKLDGLILDENGQRFFADKFLLMRPGDRRVSYLNEAEIELRRQRLHILDAAIASRIELLGELDARLNGDGERKLILIPPLSLN